MKSSITTTTAKNGKTLYFLVDENGKKTRLSNAKAEEILAAEKAKEETKMNANNLKTTRYTKVHALGEDAPEIKKNVMDITVGAESCKAEATFTSTSTYKKAAYWLCQFLGHAKAEDILALAAEEIQAKAAEASRNATEVEIDNDNWSCVIEKVTKGTYKVQMNWRLANSTAEENTPVEAPASEIETSETEDAPAAEEENTSATEEASVTAAEEENNEQA